MAVRQRPCEYSPSLQDMCIVWSSLSVQGLNICAIALFCYDIDNISESRLAFRQKAAFEQCRLIGSREWGTWKPQIFGWKNGEPPIQVVGQIRFCEGRLVTFPNSVKCRVEPFRLIDSKKPGHLKVLALALVDPTMPVLSTANVPPQQLDWWLEEVERGNGTRLGRLPFELQSQIIEEARYPMTMTAAKKIRLAMMKARGGCV